jgi:hypothetical protein
MAEISALERENTQLHEQLAGLKSDAPKKQSTVETNVVVRGLQGRLLAMADERADLEQEFTTLTTNVKTLTHVLAAEGDLNEVRVLCQYLPAVLCRCRDPLVPPAASGSPCLPRSWDCAT